VLHCCGLIVKGLDALCGIILLRNCDGKNASYEETVQAKLESRWVTVWRDALLIIFLYKKNTSQIQSTICLNSINIVPKGLIITSCKTWRQQPVVVPDPPILPVIRLAEPRELIDYPWHISPSILIPDRCRSPFARVDPTTRCHGDAFVIPRSYKFFLPLPAFSPRLLSSSFFLYHDPHSQLQALLYNEFYNSSSILRSSVTYPNTFRDVYRPHDTLQAGTFSHKIHFTRSKGQFTNYPLYAYQ